MIDKLKVGERAEHKRENSMVKVHIIVEKSEDGSILIIKNNGSREGDWLPLTSKVMKIKWKIKPNYVSFGEAMEALEKGEKVTFHDKEKKHTIGLLGSMDWTRNFTWKRLAYGKWSIEEESQ